MEMKRSVVAFTALFSLILVSGLAMAQELPAPSVIVQDFTTIFSDLLVGSSTGTDLFLRLMLVVLLTAILYMPAEKVLGQGNRTGIPLLVAFIVSLLGIRYLDATIIQQILLPYKALLITLSVLVPIIFFAILMALEALPKWVSKLGWSIFSLTFVALALFRESELAPRLGYIYLLGALISIGLFFFEGTIQNQYYKSQIKRKEGREAYMQIMDKRDNLDVAIRRLAKANTAQEKNILNEEIKEYKDQINELLKHVK